MSVETGNEVDVSCHVSERTGDIAEEEVAKLGIVEAGNGDAYGVMSAHSSRSRLWYSVTYATRFQQTTSGFPGRRTETDSRSVA